MLRAIEAMPDGQAETLPLADSMYPPPLAHEVTWITELGRLAIGTAARWRSWASGLTSLRRDWWRSLSQADGMHPDLFRVSEAGRRWLAEHDALTGGDALS